MNAARVTVAALQCPLGGPAPREHRARRAPRARRRGARSADHPAAGAVRGPLLLPRRAERVVRERRARSRRTRQWRACARSRASSASSSPCRSSSAPGQAHYNSVAIIDADGAVLGVYRKSHIPDGPGYEEKFYFRPGDTGFRVWAHALRDHRRRHLLGPVVPRVRARHDAPRRGDPLLPDRHRQRAARPRARHARPLAARDDRPRGVERDRRSSPPTASATRRASASTAPRSSPTRAATSSSSSVATTRGPSSRRSTSTPCADPRLVGIFPRPSAGAVRRARRGEPSAAALIGQDGRARRPTWTCPRKCIYSLAGTMLRHSADRRTVLWAFVLFPVAGFAPYVEPRLIPWLLPISLYLGFCAGVFSHNHNHCPVFKDRGLNAFYSAWLSVFYGFPTFAWIPTHNLNHHKYVNKAGDATITWRYSKKNTWLVASTYYFVSAYWQKPPVEEYIRKARATNPRLYRQIVIQYVTVFGGHAALLALAIALRGSSRRSRSCTPSAFVIPALFAAWSMIFINYIQHVHTDPWSEHNHSRNFVLAARQLLRLQQRLPRGAPRERGPALEQAAGGAREDRALDPPRSEAAEHLRVLLARLLARCVRRTLPHEAGGTRALRSSRRRGAEAGDGGGGAGRSGRQRLDGLKRAGSPPRNMAGRRR